VTSFLRRSLVAIATVVPLAAGAFGCTSTDDTTAAVVGPVTISVSALSENQPVTTPVLPYVLGGVTYVGALATVTNLTLRPPGDCAGLAQCGHLHVDASDITTTTFDDCTTVTGAPVSLDLGGTAIEIPVFGPSDGSQTVISGSLNVTVEVRDDTGARLVDVTGRPVPPIAFAIAIGVPDAGTCP
jgi:hypothetical protein